MDQIVRVVPVLDAYGLPVPNRFQEERKIALAREGYEGDCIRRGIQADWAALDGDTRYLWMMTADALLSYDEERETEDASVERLRAGGSVFH